MPVPLRIGISAGMVHTGQHPSLSMGLPVLFLVQGLSDWIAQHEAFPLLIPAVDEPRVPDLVRELDGLVLQGGVDICPRGYGEEPLRPEWEGDARRDAYETSLYQAFFEAGKPILGVCRGMQLINVLLGGTLYQDLPTQRPSDTVHRCETGKAGNQHGVRFTPGTRLHELHGDAGRIISIHHQGIRELAPGLRVEAEAEDGLIEAIRLQDPRHVVGIQWHPEFQPAGETNLLDPSPILQDFLTAARKARNRLRDAVW